MRWTILGLLVGTGGLACGRGQGNVNVTIWGEEFVADKIPPAMNAAAGFENDWTVRFSKFLINVGNFSVASVVGTPGGVVHGMRHWWSGRFRGLPRSGGIASRSKWFRPTLRPGPGT
jgi:hypothetical protein